MPIPNGAELFYSGVPVAGQDEIQRLTITGTPTGGTFQLVFSTQTTAAIAFNATAAQVQTALEGLAAIGVGEVACSGGPLPGSTVDIRFQNALGGLNIGVITTVGAFTGGSAPAASISTPTPGVRGTYRGAAFGAILCDTVNGIFYEQTSTSAATPTWSEVEID
jgi:hypothetical protein